MSTLAAQTAPTWLTAARARVLAIVLGVATLLVDFLTPANFVVAIVYGVPLSLLIWTRSTREVLAFAGVAVVAAIGAYLWGQPPTSGSVHQVAVANRMLSCLAILFIAGLVILKIEADQRFLRQAESLSKQNAELEAINEELSQREEEIVRQNEELQSQSEELERQSEELRVTNEELATREKMLEQLLELSRALTIDLSRSETLSKICESLVLLSGGHPAAILERHGDELEVACHFGFGAQGPRDTRIPFAQSFTSLAMSVGQTAYLEDAELRPDLRLPRPATGDAFRAVLASPLRIQGRCVGAIELYSPRPRVWDDTVVSMIESLAAQASISLQSAELMEAIRQERRRFEAAFRTVPFAMLVTDDPQAEDARFNPAGAALFNVSVDENVSPRSPAGSRLARCLAQADRALSPDDHPLARAARGEELLNQEFELVLPQGKRHTLLCCAAPILSAKGKPVGAVCAFADVTEQKTLLREIELRRREAEEASVRKTRFLAAVSHDIRTPANAINLMAELVRRYSKDPRVAGEIPRLAEDLQRNALALTELVGDVLDVARFDAGKVELVESEFPLAELLEEECAHLRPVAQEKGIELHVEPLQRPIWVRTDRVKLARVLGNLISNAIKFTREGRVSVSAEVEAWPGRRLAIHVSDTGIGIAAEHLPLIFDEFAQVHNPARDRNQGVGLGLAICKRLVDVMGGELTAESKPGDGSRFTLYLPPEVILLRLESALRQPLEVAPGPDGAGRARLKYRILLVEDHSSTREGTARILRDEGAEVIEAANGERALELLRGEKVDVALLDMMLPDMDGREVLKAIRTHSSLGLKGVFVLTGDLTRQRMDEVKELGADGLIEKPIDVKKLLAALKTLPRADRVD